MTLPPERITVKRRRDDDPVDALHLLPLSKRPSAIWRRSRTDDGPPLFSERSTSLEQSKDPRLLYNTFPTPTVPTSRTTLADTKHAHPKDVTSELFQAIETETKNSLSLEKQSPISTIPRPVRRDQNPQDAQTRLPGARLFHLTRSASTASSHYHICKTPPQKHRKSRKELAVFVERTEKALKAQQARSDGEENSDPSSGTVTTKAQEIQELARARKRPNATAAERKWRTDNWGRPVESVANATNAPKLAQSVNEPSNQWDYKSPLLAEQLQQIALQEIQAHKKRSKDLNASQLKTQPKPPKPRQPESELSAGKENGDYTVVDAVDSNDDSIYVFDTYIRSSVGKEDDVHNIELPVAVVPDMNSGSFGIIVIDDDQEELWETYGEDHESDAECDSEEEDENAEDFYGNDYPEDEVESDDEFDRGAYNYRHDASDDEEYGEGVATWSDEEKTAQRLG